MRASVAVAGIPDTAIGSAQREKQLAEHHALREMAALWREGQRAFWSAAAGGRGASCDARAVDRAAEAPEPAAFDGFWTELCGSAAPPDRSESSLALAEAGARYRAVVLAAWRRIRQAFEVERRAITEPGRPPPDWRLLRERWFAIAEAEFVRTQRSDAFLDAQRGALRAVIRWRMQLGPEEQERLEAVRAAARSGSRLAAALGLENVRIAATPKETVWRAGKATLSRYRPLGAQPRLGPLLICYGLIGRQTMTDLTPERSLVRNLLAAGVDVFVLDWGHAGPEDARNGFGHYSGDLLGKAVGRVLAESGASRAVLFGICQGGTMAVCHAVLNHARLAGVVLAVTPVDFHADIHDADPAHGLLNLWIRSLTEDDLDALIGLDGGLSGELMGIVFNQLNPVRTIAKYAAEFPETTADPRALATFLAMERWLADRPDLPGALARSWLVELYRRNALVAGQFSTAGTRIDLRRIGVPVLNVFATGDHIIPPPCSRALGRLVDPRLYEELALPTGHVGVFVSARSQVLLAPAVVSWLGRLG
jgi:polyhydroxyalkanoate synthase